MTFSFVFASREVASENEGLIGVTGFFSMSEMSTEGTNRLSPNLILGSEFDRESAQFRTGTLNSSEEENFPGKKEGSLPQTSRLQAHNISFE